MSHRVFDQTGVRSDTRILYDPVLGNRTVQWASILEDLTLSTVRRVH